MPLDRSPHLRLHEGEAFSPPQRDLPLESEWEQILDALEDLSGWRVERRGWSVAEGRWVLAKELDPDQPASLSLEQVRHLLDPIQSLARRLHRTEQVVRRQHAELATGIHFTLDAKEQSQLADRWQRTLGDASLAMGMQAASMYLLTEDHRSLQPRAAWGSLEGVLIQAPRPLRGARADLEALLGKAVLLRAEDTQIAWARPEPFPAAICVPVGTESTPLGTLWFWSERPRDFDRRDIAIATMAADQMVGALQQFQMVRQLERSFSIQSMMEDAGWAQAAMLPTRTASASAIQWDGWTSQAGPVGGAFHDWHQPDSQRLRCAIGASQQQSVTGAMVATTLQTLLQHTWLEDHSIEQALPMIDQRLGQLPRWTPNGHQSDWSQSGLAWADFDANQSSVKLALHGQVGALCWGPDGCRFLGGGQRPLGDSTLGKSSTGTTPAITTIPWQPGTGLLLWNAAVADLGPEATATPDVLPWSQLVQLVESHSDLPISEFCLAIARHLPNSADPQETNHQDRTLLAFRAEC
ncbi:MAG: GAF domain-containing protein [Pirellulaceae bacterium]